MTWLLVFFVSTVFFSRVLLQRFFDFYREIRVFFAFSPFPSEKTAPRFGPGVQEEKVPKPLQLGIQGGPGGFTLIDIEKT